MSGSAGPSVPPIGLSRDRKVAVELDEIRMLAETSPAWRLLRARNAPLVMASLGRVFVEAAPAPGPSRISPRRSTMERSAYEDLVTDRHAERVRLEQERVDWAWVLDRWPVGS